jgi:hypothetical protein
MSTLSSTRAPRSTRTSGEITLLCTEPPPMITPGLTIDSSARPPSTNFAGGSCGGSV